jgi:putative transposase
MPRPNPGQFRHDVAIVCPWSGLEDVEWATLSYVDWFNNRRLHGQITPGPGYTTSAAFEGAHYRQTTPALGAGTP